MLLCACHQNVHEKDAFNKEDAYTGKDKDSANKPFTLQETGEKEGRRRRRMRHVCCLHICAVPATQHASSSTTLVAAAHS